MSYYHKRAGILGRQARRWARLRRVVLDAANWRCSRCGRYAREVDHKRPLHMGGAVWDRKNLQVLCRAHHTAKSAKENRRPLTPAEQKWKGLVSAMVAGR